LKRPPSGGLQAVNKVPALGGDFVDRAPEQKSEEASQGRKRGDNDQHDFLIEKGIHFHIALGIAKYHPGWSLP
jgi:hypothetical protein